MNFLKALVRRVLVGCFVEENLPLLLPREPAIAFPADRGLGLGRARVEMLSARRVIMRRTINWEDEVQGRIVGCDGPSGDVRSLSYFDDG